MRLFLSMFFLLIPCMSIAATTPAPKYDTKLPIEISSNSLEVRQHESKAIFKGNVIAVQGKIRLKADIMNVYYQQKSAQQSQPKQPIQSSGQTPGAMGAITRIEVMGNVFVATPEESAKGDRGDYQVASKTIHLFGDNVTLTRDKNILRGTALEYNLETGRSLLTNQGGSVTSTGKGDGRVRGLFVPESDKK